LNPELRSLLASDPGGEPDDAGWGEICSYIYYSQLQHALSDPNTAVDALRTQWIKALGPGTSSAYPSKWILAATLAQLLTVTGDRASAATVAASSVSMFETPLNTAELQLRAHLSEMHDSDPVPARASSAAHAGQLLHQLSVLVVREPDALNHTSQDLLAGLTELISPHRRRLRWAGSET